MRLRIGKRLSVEVADLREASIVYQRERDASGEGASTFPFGRVGKYTVSYNGRVWLGDLVVLEAQSMNDFEIYMLWQVDEFEAGDLDAALDWADGYDVARAHEHPALNWALGQLALTEYYVRPDNVLRCFDPGDGPDGDIVECTVAEFVEANADGMCAEELELIAGLRPGEEYRGGGGAAPVFVVICIR